MLRNFSNFISYIFHPLLMPFYSMLLIFNLPSYIAYSIKSPLQFVILTMVFVTTFVLPVLFTLFLVQKKVIASMHLEQKEERRLPYLATILFYLFAYYLMRWLRLPMFFQLIILGATCVIFAGFLINLKWKISVHTMGIGGVAGLLWSLSEILYIQVTTPFIILILISGIIGTARLIRNAHLPSQIYSGFLIGFAIEFLVMQINF